VDQPGRWGAEGDSVAEWSRVAAVFSNSYRAPHPWIDSTGFRTHGLQYRSLSNSQLRRPGDDFLANSRYLRYDRETEESIQSYFLDPGILLLSMLGQEERAGLKEVALPRGVQLRRELGHVLSGRRSRRNYTGDPMDLPYIATVLRSASAITAKAEMDRTDGGHSTVAFRTAPSGGGLYPVDLYMASLRVNRLDRGLYRYDPLSDRLVLLGGEEHAVRLTKAIAVPEEIIAISRAGALLLLVGYPARSTRKYGQRGVRYMFIEAGAMAQNIHLACEALGLGSVDCASIYDDDAHEALGLDGQHQVLVHAVVLGHPG
jgi:SagB-type dehydrogenase family enzyme